MDGFKHSISRSGARKSAVELEHNAITVVKSSLGNSRNACLAEVSWRIKKLHQHEITVNELAPAGARLKATPEIKQTNMAGILDVSATRVSSVRA